MKNYIGVKIVKAMPGTMAEAQAMKCGCPVDFQKKISQQSGAKDRRVHCEISGRLHLMESKGSL